MVGMALSLKLGGENNTQVQYRYSNMNLATAC